VSAVEQLAELVRLESGISLRPSQLSTLELAVARAAPGESAEGFLRLASEPVRGRALVERLLDEVTVQETSFLRHASELERIEWQELAARARAGGRERIRAWAAGCATGEEAYTLALLACEAFGHADPPVDVLGTDISRPALESARGGRYRTRSVAAVDEALRGRHFTEAEGAFTVRDHLRRPVRFARHNLVHDPVPPLGEGRFDLVVCRNVLIYFDPATTEQVIAALERAVEPGAMLLLGAADSLSGATQTLADATPGRPPRPVRTPPEELLERALQAADKGQREDALHTTAELLAEDPLNADAHFVRGLVLLSGGETAAAVESLRRALYVDPGFGLASFQLGRAYDALADTNAARQAYEHALAALDPDSSRHDALLRQVDLGDVARACRARLAALRA